MEVVTWPREDTKLLFEILFFNTRRGSSYPQAVKWCSYININEIPNHFTSIFACINHGNDDLYTWLFSHVKLSCFRTIAHLVFHWILYKIADWFCLSGNSHSRSCSIAQETFPMWKISTLFCNFSLQYLFSGHAYFVSKPPKLFASAVLFSLHLSMHLFCQNEVFLFEIVCTYYLTTLQYFSS